MITNLKTFEMGLISGGASTNYTLIGTFDITPRTLQMISSDFLDSSQTLFILAYCNSGSARLNCFDGTFYPVTASGQTKAYCNTGSSKHQFAMIESLDCVGGSTFQLIT